MCLIIFGCQYLLISNKLNCSQPSISDISSLPLPFPASLRFNVDSHICALELEQQLFCINWYWHLIGVASTLFVNIYKFIHLARWCHPGQHSDQTTPVVQFPAGAKDFLFYETFTLALGPPSVLFNTHRSSFLGSKAAGAWGHSSSECGVETKNEWSYMSAPVRFHGVCRNNLPLPLPLRAISTYASVLGFSSFHFVGQTLHELKCEHNRYTVSYMFRHFSIAFISESLHQLKVLSV